MVELAYPSDTQFAGLVEAATAAADQEVDWSHNDGGANSTQQPFDGDHNQGYLENSYTAAGAEQYDPSLRRLGNGVESDGARGGRSTRKRKRGAGSTGDRDPHAEQQAAGPSEAGQSSPSKTPAGVHSAAALFRAPSTSSKKYTRPPMSKLFSSLQLLPEEFLHLQSAAKAYMLDDDRPERRDCVGQRGKTDSDMVKLKLLNCVEDFLDRGGNGEKFFGANARKAEPGNGSPTMNWPEDAQQIIKTCVPLLRRMVTNERQRQYAVETRKGGGDAQKQTHHQSLEHRDSRPSRASLDGLDTPETFTIEKMDIFGDGVIPEANEGSEWYDMYNNDSVLDRIFVKSGLPRVMWLPLVLNIDAHCRLYHETPGNMCNDSCKSRLVERLLQSSLYQQHSPARDIWETTREIFNIVLSHLIRIRYWDSRQPEDVGARNRGSSKPAQEGAYTVHRSSSRRKAATKSAEEPASTNGHNWKNSLQLHINIVRKDKLLLQSFELPSSKCPSIDALRAEVERHYGPLALNFKGVKPLKEAALKVWMPDGLVKVEDDGQWMVALLSADTIEWMGGQVRVLLEG
jgi:hypothetical protein